MCTCNLSHRILDGNLTAAHEFKGITYFNHSCTGFKGSHCNTLRGNLYVGLKKKGVKVNIDT